MSNILKQLGMTPKDIIVGFLFQAIASTLAIIVGSRLESISFLHIDWLRIAEISIVIFILLSWFRLKQKMQTDGVRLREEYEKAIIAHQAAYTALLEDTKNACKQDVTTAKEELTTIINSNISNLSKWIEGHAGAHKWEHEEFKRQQDVLEQRLKAKKVL